MSTMPSNGHHPVALSNGSLASDHNYSKEPMDIITSISSPHMTVSNPEEQNLNMDERPLSPNEPINIFSGGGWDDEDDDDDYVDMKPMTPKFDSGQASSSKFSSHASAKSENLVTTRSNDSGYYDEPSSDNNRRYNPNHLSLFSGDKPSVVILPASPHSSIGSHASARSRAPSVSPSVESISDSCSNVSHSSPRSFVLSPDELYMEENNNDEDYVLLPHQVPDTPTSVFVESRKPPPGPRKLDMPSEEYIAIPSHSASSSAGKAARKYLQMQKSSSRPSNDSPKSPTGLQRSSSRVGNRGVQSRIKSRNQIISPTKNQPSAFCDLEKSKAVSDPRINEAKRKSRTLERDLSGTARSTETTNSLAMEDMESEIDSILAGDEKRRSRDGAAVMKMIMERRKSRSLDGKYLQYLQGVAKHASVPPLSNEDSRNKKQKEEEDEDEVEEDYDDDEEDEELAFARYAASMSAKKCADAGLKVNSLDRDDSEVVFRTLSDFANDNSKSKSGKSKKRLQTASFAQKLSFRKSKTLNKSSSDTKLSSFAEAAEAFHEELKKQSNESAQTEVERKEKSNSLKKEKRKSWKMKRHGLSIKYRSRDRLNSDPDKRKSLSQPPTPTKDGDVPDYGTEDKNKNKNSKMQPAIKQSLRVDTADSPSLRPRKVSDGEKSPDHRSRATSYERNSHSPLIMSPVAGRSVTLGRGMKGFSDSGHMYRADSNNFLGSQQALKSVSSLASENSGSNSDISIQYEEDMDDRKERKAGTLSRFLGRKARERRYEAEFEDDIPNGGRLQDLFSTGSLGRRKKGKSSTLSSPAMALRMRHANSRETLLENCLSRQDLFFDPSEFIHGFRIIFDDDSDESELPPELELAIRKSASKGRVNKYATITGSRSHNNGNYETKRRTADSSYSEGYISTGEGSSQSKRNNSLPALLPSPTLRSKSRMKKNSGPGGHLAFGDVLTENEEVHSDRQNWSPLRTRKRQIVEPLHEEPSVKILAAAKVLYRRLTDTNSEIIRMHKANDEKDQFGSSYHTNDETNREENTVASYEDSFYGQDLVTWVVDQLRDVTNGQESNDASTKASRTRENVVGVLQALLEEGAISHVRKEHHFQDTFLLYQFHESVTRIDDPSRPVSFASTVTSSTSSTDPDSTNFETNGTEIQNFDDVSRRMSRGSDDRSSTFTEPDRLISQPVEDQELRETLSYLQNVAPDAMFRMVLRKLPEDRTAEELMMIYEEILRIKALAHLSDSVKRELAGVLKFEFHRKQGKTLFSQGDEGRSWYIIVKGSVNVDIQGQGVVCTLHEGDDFGNLAIINDAPRAATIVLAEDNCQLLRVDKNDFVRILKDVEANTVRLKEHDKEVLILQKIHTRSSSQDGRPVANGKARVPAAATPTRTHQRYAISAGTPAKIVEHIVKSLKPWSTARQSDEAMEDLILMYQVFMNTQELCEQLMKQYHSERTDRIDASTSIKRKVVYFVVRWSHIATHIFHDQPAVGPFLKELKQAVTDDSTSYPNLKEDLARVYQPEVRAGDGPLHKGWITVEYPTVQRYPQTDNKNAPHQPIRADDDVVLKVYNAQRTYTTVRLPIISTVSEIITAVAEKQSRSPENLLLIHVKSDGDMYVLPKKMTSAATSVGVNSRFFICTKDEKNDIEPLAEQRITIMNSSSVLELVSTQEIAEHITQFDWELINSIHVMEFVHKVFGSHKFHSVTSNIDVFARRFNQLAYWAPTEICACNNLNKRVHLLRKFIKIAQHLKDLQNMNAFMAVIIGLGNQAVSRLHNTWDKLPSKYKKMMTEFEAILDPSRNHRTYRLYVANLRPPLIPYLPLLMKDMTFQHEGNDTMRNSLVNFEKMHMMSNSIRDVIHACSRPLELSHAVSTAKTFEDSRQYTRNFAVITDQKYLNQMSAKSEAKR